MPAAQILFVLILLALCSFAPGFFIVRRFRWNPLEKLCASVGLSLILLYLVSWATYLLAPAAQPAVYLAVSAVCAVLAVAAWQDLARLFRVSRIRRVLACFGFLTVWSSLILAMIRVYTGAGWSADWLEHFQRSLFFLQRFPVNTSIYPGYQLPARPPLMNVLGAFFLGQAGDRFEVFQFVFLFLNLLPFLACCLLMPALAGRGKRLGKWSMLPLAGIFAMSPLIMESVTYTWTKALAAFFVILAITFYLAALRKGDSPRMIAAFLAISAGLLAHYSAGPYIVILTLHYLFVAFRKRRAKLKELAAIAVLCGLLLFTWFGWSLRVYGMHTTVASNTAVTDSQRYQGNGLEKIAANLFDTVVPRIVRDPDSVHTFDQPNNAGFIRDNAFIVYQTNLVFGMGVVGGPLVVLLLCLWLRKNGSGPERTFWLILIPAAIVLGIAVIGERDPNGLAHLTLLPMEILGLTWLAVNFCLRRWVACLILAGSLVDFPLGVLLQARVENLENRPSHLFYGNGPESLSGYAGGNWLAKHQVAVARQALNRIDRSQGEGPQFARSAAQVRGRFQQLLDEDQTRWQGWYSRHGGEVTLFGDWFGDAWVPFYALLAAWLALLWTLWRHLPRPAVPVRPIASARAKTRRKR